MLQYTNYSDHEIELFKREWVFGNYQLVSRELINLFNFQFQHYLVTLIVTNNYKTIQKFTPKHLKSKHSTKRFLGAYDYFMSEDFRKDCKFLGLTYDDFLGLNIEEIHKKYMLIFNQSQLKEAA